MEKSEHTPEAAAPKPEAAGPCRDGPRRRRIWLWCALAVAASVAVLVVRLALGFTPGEHLLFWVALIAVGTLISVLNSALFRARRSAEAALHEQVELESRLSRIAATAPEVFFTYRSRPDGSGCFPYTSPAVERVYGIRPEVLVEDASPVFRAIHPDDIGRVSAGIAETVRTLSPWLDQFRVLNPQRGVVWVEAHSTPLREPDGGTVWHGFVADITERKCAEQALRESEATLRSYVEHAPVGVLVADASGRHVEANRTAEALLGYASGGLVGTCTPDLVAEDDREAAARHFAQVVQEGFADGIFRLRRGDGQNIWANVRAVKVGDDRFLAIIQDLTQKIRAEAELRTSEEKFRSYVENAPVAVFVTDGDGNYLEANREAVDLLGYDIFALSRMNISDVLSDQDRPAGLRGFACLVETGHLEGEFRLKRRDGELVWVSLSAARISHDQFLAHCLDISERRTAEERLREREAQYRAVFETSADGFWVADSQGRILEVNDAYARRSGYSRDELLAMRISDLEAREEPEQVASHLERIIREGSSLFETLHRTKDGAVWQAEVNTTYWPIAGGRLFVFVRDIYRRKRSEALLHTRYALSELARGGSLEELLQFAREAAELSTGSPAGFFHFVDADGERPGQNTSREGVWEECVHSRAPVIHNDEAAGRNLTVPILRANRVAAVMGVANKPADYTEEDVAEVRDLAWVVMDLVDAKRAEEALRRSEERHRALVETTFDWIWEVDADGRFTYTSPKAAELLGFTAEEMIGRTPFDFMPAEEARRVGDIFAGIAARRQPFSALENINLHRNGRKVVLEASGVPVFGIDGEFKGYRGSDRDITERKQAEQRRAIREAVSRVLAEAASLNEATPGIVEALCQAAEWDFGAIWRVDKHANVLRGVEVWQAAGVAATELAAGCSTSTFALGSCLLGKVWSCARPLVYPAMAHHADCPRTLEAARAGLTNSLAFSIQFGGRVTGVVELWGRDQHDPDPRLLETFTAIGNQLGEFMEHKRAEEEVRRFVSCSPAVIYALKVEEDLRPSWVSDNVFDLTGYRADETLSRQWWIDNIHPEDRDRVLASSGGPGVEPQILEFRFLRKDGIYFWVRDEKRLLRDAQGRPSEIVGSWSDVTQRVALEEQLRQAQKMEAVGTLAGGVAHDFNNLLTVINGYSQLMLGKLNPSDPLRTKVDEIRKAGERAAGLTRQLLAFSRKQVMQPQLLRLNQVVGSFQSMLERLVGDVVDLETNLNAMPDLVWADRSQLEQVLLNLVINARDAMPGGGTLVVETGNSEPAEQTRLFDGEGRAGRTVLLSVTDTGIGMDEETQRRIFEPFFTTKGPNEGTGLGLAMVQGIVAQSGGRIEVSSRPGQGTSFRVYLPLADGEAKDGQTGREADVAPSRETVLIVEDQPEVREYVALALSTFGYRVIDAQNGPDAMALCERERDSIDLVLTDVVMPGMGGRELAGRLSVICPGIRILYMSGYAEDAVARRELFGASAEFIQKPFSPEQLAAKVREALAGRSAR